jgi:hypothetical protein
LLGLLSYEEKRRLKNTLVADHPGPSAPLLITRGGTRLGNYVNRGNLVDIVPWWRPNGKELYYVGSVENGPLQITRAMAPR